MRRVLLGILLGLCAPLSLWGQSSPGLLPRAHTFAELPSSARLLALGGVNLTASADDVNLLWANPALLNPAHHNHLGIGYQAYYRSHLLQATYAYDQPWGTLGAAVSSWNLGEIEAYDEAGVPMGTFSTGAWVSSLSYARTQGPFRLGASLKLTGNQLATTGRVAFLMDVGGIYQHPTQDLRVGIVASNFGTVFGGVEGQTLPWNVRVGASYKPQHMPVRLSVTLTDLYQWSTINYDSTTSQTIPPPSVAETIFSHVVLGGELVLGKSLSGFVGFNPKRRIEMSLPSFGGLAGFSMGLEARIRQFSLGYGVGFYHLAGGTHQLTLTTNLSEGFTRKRTINTPIEGLE